MERDVNEEALVVRIRELMAYCGSQNDSFQSELVLQLIQTSLRFLWEGHDTGQLKLIARAMKEMRNAYRIFNHYEGVRRVSIFGSARTPPDHPDYLLAKKFSSRMAESGWMCITGGAHGIMKAGLEGAKKEAGFGLTIKLPFETANEFIEGDPKQISFKYFFTRKLMFMSHSDAVVAFPGGVGTMDELFEVLTLMQTGKAHIMPVILMEGGEGGYWKTWDEFVEKQFLAKGWISAEDRNFYTIAQGVDDAVAHIQQFYHRYHSSRYVKDQLVIRLHQALHPQQIDKLNAEFSILFKTGKIESCNPFSEENDHLELPRITFCHTRSHFGTLRALIDAINGFK